MTFYIVNERQPSHGRWYLVTCPGYCRSGYFIAKWDNIDKRWIAEGDCGPIDEYVTRYAEIPN